MRPYATRSFAEVRFVAYLLHALRLLLKLREVLLRGDTCLQSDAAIDMEELLCIFVFDPGYTHPPERGDHEKTLRLLALDDAALVVRLRVDACDVAVRDPRCVIMHSRAASDGALLVALARGIAHRLPEPYRSRLLAAGSERRPLAECVAEDMWCELKPAFEKRCAEIDAFLSVHNLWEAVSGTSSLHCMPVRMSRKRESSASSGSSTRGLPLRWVGNVSCTRERRVFLYVWDSLICLWRTKIILKQTVRIMREKASDRCVAIRD
jgi:hypothetical protein